MSKAENAHYVSTHISPELQQRCIEAQAVAQLKAKKKITTSEFVRQALASHCDKILNGQTS